MIEERLQTSADILQSEPRIAQIGVRLFLDWFLRLPELCVATVVISFAVKAGLPIVRSDSNVTGSAPDRTFLNCLRFLHTIIFIRGGL
jgi:hypothetical protein